MIIRCTKCSTEFALDPSQVGAEGVTLRCSVCSHMFHAEPDPEAIQTPWKVHTADRRSLVLPDLRRVLEQVEDGRLRPEDQLSHTGDNFIRLGEMPEFSSLFIGVEGLPRVFKAVEASAAVPEAPHREDDIRREETVRVRVHNVLGGVRVGVRDDDPLPAPPDFASVPEPPARHMTMEFVSRGASHSSGPHGHANTSHADKPGRAHDTLPAPPEFAARQTNPSGSHRALTNPLVGGPIAAHGHAAESGNALPAPPEFDAPPTRGRTTALAAAAPPPAHVPADPRPRKPPPASMLEAVTKVVGGDDRDEGSPDGEASRTRSSPILVADLARAAAAHAEKAVQAVDSQRAREKAARGDAETSTTGRAATAAAVTAAMAIARESTREPAARPTATERAPVDPPRTTDKLPAERPPTVRLESAIATPSPHDSTPAAEPVPASTSSPLPRPPEVVIVKVQEPAKGGSGVLVALLGVAAAAAVVFGVPSIRERVFNLGGPAPVTKAEPSKAPPAAIPSEEFKAARAAVRSLGLKETNKAQTSLQKIVDDPKRSPAAVAQARQLLAELLLVRGLACKIAVSLDPSAMSGEAEARSSEDPPAAKDQLAALGEQNPDIDPEAQRRIAAYQALIAGTSPSVTPGDDELAALVRAAPLWRGQIKTPPSGLISDLRRLPAPSTLSQSVLALALLRSGDEAGTREILLEVLKTVPDQPVARTLLDTLDRQGMMTELGDPEVPAEGDPIPLPPVDTPRPVDPGKAAVKPAGISGAVEIMISTGCQQVRAGDPEGVKLLLAAIDRGARPRENFNLSFCLGNGFARQNAHDTAFTWYASAVVQSPSNRDAVAGAARSAELLGRTAVAVEYYRKLHNLEPNNAAAAAYLNKYDKADAPDDSGVPPEEPPDDALIPVIRKKTP